MSLLVHEFFSLCVGEDMGLWLCANVALRGYEDVGLCRNGFVWLLVCLLVRWHVNLQLAYCPSFHKPFAPSSLGGRAGKGVFILFVLLPFCQNMFDFTSRLHNHSRLF